ncbi:porin family protein [Fulvivirgaceae bacterium BMA10]|uniref:Porin family protein n=1 Tax=Splendidivirga corallicola TaxID=3051826 RepID=A0ABT8KJW4_9BACT|nr:porin family protein [Fulvivirgaceae bacterium BMA10]
MKKTIVLALAILLCYSTYGQVFTLGPKIGISSSEVKIKNNLTNIRNKDASFGFHAGLFTRLTIAGFYVQPEALFTSSGGTIEVDGNGGSLTRQAVDLKFNKLDVPVMFGTKFLKIFRLQAGPVVNLLLNADAKTNAGDIDIKESYKNATVGYQAGVGLDISKLTIDLKYEGNLSSIGDNLNLLGQSFQTDQRNRQLILSLGIKLI